MSNNTFSFFESRCILIRHLPHEVATTFKTLKKIPALPFGMPRFRPAGARLEQLKAVP